MLLSLQARTGASSSAAERQSDTSRRAEECVPAVGDARRAGTREADGHGLKTRGGGLIPGRKSDELPPTESQTYPLLPH